jgi:hypothetical protein
VWGWIPNAASRSPCFASPWSPRPPTPASRRASAAWSCAGWPKPASRTQTGCRAASPGPPSTAGWPPTAPRALPALSRPPDQMPAGPGTRRPGWPKPLVYAGSCRPAPRPPSSMPSGGSTRCGCRSAPCAPTWRGRASPGRRSPRSPPRRSGASRRSGPTSCGAAMCATGPSSPTPGSQAAAGLGCSACSMTTAA